MTTSEHQARVDAISEQEGALAPAAPAPVLGWRDGRPLRRIRQLAVETPVAFTFEGTTQAVMLATPVDLDDFAVGFCLTEGIAPDAGAILAVETIESPQGVELRIALRADCRDRLAARRRAQAGPVGCGLCGIESLAEALPLLPVIESAGPPIPAAQILAAMAALEPAQAFNRVTSAHHAAGFWKAGRGLVLAREDVGRHNALDKLCGALARRGEMAADGLLLLTSRVSVELVQKSARAGFGVMVAVSAPTELAVRAAEAAGVTLVGIARPDGFETFAHPGRIVF